MLEVAFKIEPEELGIGVEDVVNILVDGVRLQELVRAVELPFAQAEGHPEWAGRYAGLLAEPDILWPSRHFLGEPAMALDGLPYLLGCTCGIAEDGPLAARIEVSTTTVTWSDWRTRGHWDLSKLGTLVFDRKRYEDALRLLSQP